MLKPEYGGKDPSGNAPGGIYDQVGFGFHRYSTDEKWLVPHFEKMLYDQAMLATAYIEAFQATSKEEYARTAREIFTYVLREMTDNSGGFYSAEDADSEGEEGKFYLWTPGEIYQALLPDEADFIIKVFNITENGNFTDDASRDKTGRNILHLAQPLDDIAKMLKPFPARVSTGGWSRRGSICSHIEKNVSIPIKTIKCWPTGTD